MYALALNGSPRKGGNTEVMLKTTLEPLRASGWETELVQIGGRNMRGCIACMQCWEKKNDRCVVDNDAFNEVFEKMLAADAIIIGSPTYFADVSAETKAVLDRSGFVALANDYKLAGKIGAAVISQRRSGGMHAFDTVNHMFLMSRMIVPGSTYWNLAQGMDLGDIAEKSPEEMTNLQNLAHMIDWLGKAIRSSIDSFPKAEPMFSN